MSDSTDRISQAVSNISTKVLSIYILTVMAIVAAFGATWHYSAAAPDRASIPISLGIAAFVVIVIVVFMWWRNSRIFPSSWESDKAFIIIVSVFIVASLGWQLGVFLGGRFEVGWDPAILANPHRAQEYAWYFSRYPNQLFLAGLFRDLEPLASALHFDHFYAFAQIISSLAVIFSTALLVVVARRLGGYQFAYATMIVSAVFITFSPWFLVPYSDTLAMPFVSLTAFVAVFVKPRWARWGIFTAIFIIGYAVKPTIIFAPASFFAFEILALFAGRNRPGLARSLTAALVTIVLSAVGSSMVVKTVSDTHLSLDTEQAFALPHYLMMGANAKQFGGYSRPDVDYSLSFTTKEARQSANIARWKERVSDLGLSGITQLAVRKTLSNYSDGTFSWAREGTFFYHTYGNSEAIKSLYGINDGMKKTDIHRSALFAPVANVVWFSLLIGIVLLVFKRRPSSHLAAMAIALLLISAFLTIFECRARYLILYSPYFVILGVAGIFSASQKLSRYKEIPL